MSEWAVTGLPVGVAHDVGVAVVGGDREERAGCRRVVGVDGFDGGDDPAEAVSIAASAASVASQTPVWPTMSGLA